MGNYCIKLCEKLQTREKCPYCKKFIFVGKIETSFKIITQGCRVCRIKMKYFDESSNTLGKNPHNQIYKTTTFTPLLI